LTPSNLLFTIQSRSTLRPDEKGARQMKKASKWDAQKEMKCPRCGETSIFRKDVDYDADHKSGCGKPIWVCNLCDHQIDRQIRRSAKEELATPYSVDIAGAILGKSL